VPFLRSVNLDVIGTASRAVGRCPCRATTCFSMHVCVGTYSTSTSAHPSGALGFGFGLTLAGSEQAEAERHPDRLNPSDLLNSHPLEHGERKASSPKWSAPGRFGWLLLLLLAACMVVAAAAAVGAWAVFSPAVCTPPSDLLGVYGDLGNYSFPVRTVSRRAQALFDQGMVLRFAFTQVRGGTLGCRVGTPYYAPTLPGTVSRRGRPGVCGVGRRRRQSATSPRLWRRTRAAPCATGASRTPLGRTSTRCVRVARRVIWRMGRLPLQASSLLPLDVSGGAAAARVARGCAARVPALQPRRPSESGGGGSGGGCGGGGGGGGSAARASHERTGSGALAVVRAGRRKATRSLPPPRTKCS
jgi:uncharacterized membrane protein YgcG